MSQLEQHNIFISYGRGDDIPFVEKLYSSLKANDYKVWFDKENLESNGLSFLQNIRDSLVLNNMRLLLIVGPHSSKSDYVRYEWEFTLANCMTVIPLLRLGYEKNSDGTIRESNTDYDLIPEPIKKRRFHCIDFRRSRPYEQALKELLLNLSTPIPPLCKLFSVPNKPANFIPRNVDIEKIKEIVIADVYNPGVITSISKSTAVQGMGGIGKSVLAAAVCQDCDVMRSFSDGIYWITIGQEKAEINVVNGIQLLTGSEQLNFKDNYENVRNKLREILKDKNCLIVLDDVWNQSDISIFPSDQALRYRLLITTRNKQTVQNLVAKVYEIGLLNDEEARILLSKAVSSNSISETVLSVNLPAEADLIIEECGHLPLAIAMAGGMISSEGKERWKDVLEALQEADLSYIERRFPDYPYSNLFKVLDVSVTLLNELIKQKYLQLAIFPKDSVIPTQIIHLLWKNETESGRHTNKHLDELVDRSLIQRIGEGLYALHDLQTDYLKGTCKKLKELNKQFITRLGDPLRLSNKYSWSNYIWHLKEAGEIETAINLLQNFEWIKSKLFSTNINEVLKDYELIKLNDEAEEIYRALKNSAHILLIDPKQLSSQLIGRLGENGFIKIKEFVKNAERIDFPWLRPMSSSLVTNRQVIRSMNLPHLFEGINIIATSNNKALVGSYRSSSAKLGLWNFDNFSQFIELDQFVAGPVFAVAISNDGKIGIVSSDENGVQVIDLEKHTLMFELAGWDLYITSICLSRDGTLAVLGSQYGIIYVFDLLQREFIQKFSAFEKELYSVAISKDGSQIICGSNGSAKIWGIGRGKANLLHVLPHESKIICVSFQGETADDESTALRDDYYSFTPNNRVVQDEKYVVTVGENGYSTIWNKDNGIKLFEKHTHLDSPYERFKVTYIDPHTIIFGRKKSIISNTYKLDYTGSLWTREYRGHTKQVNAVAVTPDGKRAISTSEDQAIILWDLDEKDPIPSGLLLDEIRGYCDVEISIDQHYIIRTGYDGRSLWELKEYGNELCRFSDEIKNVLWVSKTNNGLKGVTKNNLDQLQVWDLENSKEVGTLSTPIPKVIAATINLKGDLITFAEEFGYRAYVLRVWDFATNKEINMVQGQYLFDNSILHKKEKKFKINENQSVVVSPNGCIQFEGNLKFNKRITCENSIEVICISSDSRISSTIYSNGTLSVWNLTFEKCIANISGNVPFKFCALNPNCLGVAALDTADRIHYFEIENYF